MPGVKGRGEWGWQGKGCGYKSITQERDHCGDRNHSVSWLYKHQYLDCDNCTILLQDVTIGGTG